MKFKNLINFKTEKEIIPDGFFDARLFINKNNKQLSLSIQKKNVSPKTLSELFNKISLNKKIRLRIEEIPTKKNIQKEGKYGRVN